MLTEEFTVIEGTGAHHQQVLELAGVAVVEHLAEQAVSHRVTCAAGELVENLILIDNRHIDAIDSAVQRCHALGLVMIHFVGDNEQFGSLKPVQVLISNRLIG